MGGAAPISTDVTALVTGLRSEKGQILGCMTRRPDAFPGCVNDPQAKRLVVPATLPRLTFGHVPEGRYAISLIHDENGNGKLDKRLMIPREGFGFSRNPKITFGPPKFSAVEVAVGQGDVKVPVKMKYYF